MGTTPTFDLPFPEPPDPATVPADIAAPAAAVDEVFVTVDGRDDGQDAALAALDGRVTDLEDAPAGAAGIVVASLTDAPAGAPGVVCSLVTPSGEVMTFAWSEAARR